MLILNMNEWATRCLYELLKKANLILKTFKALGVKFKQRRILDYYFGYDWGVWGDGIPTWNFFRNEVL